MCMEISKATQSNVKGEMFCYVAMFPNDDPWNYCNPLTAYKAVSDPDTLNYCQAMKEEDRESSNRAV